MTQRITRRGFLGSAAATAAGIYLLPGCSSVPAIPPRRAIAANEKLRLGIIGVANRGGDNLQAVSSEDIVAICDADEGYLAKAKQQFPAADDYTDYRLMIANMKLDAVVVSTPDHHHALATSLALAKGLDVYCEKPLTHDIHEARFVRELAKKMGSVTQMGIQIHEHDNYRRVVELVKGGILGEIREVHVFVNGTTGRPRASPPRATRFPRICASHSGLAPPPSAPTARRTTRPAGAAIGSLAMGPWATWLAISWISPSGRSTSARRRPSKPKGPPSTAMAAPMASWSAIAFRRAEPSPRRAHLVRRQAPPPILATLGYDKWINGVLFIGDKGHLIANYDIHELGPKDKWEGFTPGADHSQIHRPPPRVDRGVQVARPHLLRLRLRGPPHRDRFVGIGRLPPRRHARVGRRSRRCYKCA